MRTRISRTTHSAHNVGHWILGVASRVPAGARVPRRGVRGGSAGMIQTHRSPAPRHSRGLVKFFLEGTGEHVVHRLPRRLILVQHAVHLVADR